DRAADFGPGGPLHGYQPTLAGAGSDEGIDSNGVPAAPDSGLPSYVVVAEVSTPDDGHNDHSFDFGFVPILVSIGDYVWIDLDRDGVQDPDEDPVAEVVVRLLDSGGNLLEETTTDGNGYYAFTDLIATEDYIVEFPTTVTVNGVTY